jgi:3-hydroxy-5-methyl-1-naphthoate 3-O-methyltransferase
VAGASDHIDVATGDMFSDPLPVGADLIVLCWIPHDWDDDRCDQLLRRCFDALPSGGRILLLEMVLDEDHSSPASVALMSLNMLVATSRGRERTDRESRRCSSALASWNHSGTPARTARSGDRS